LALLFVCDSTLFAIETPTDRLALEHTKRIG
jgi:hypothetical protein